VFLARSNQWSSIAPQPDDCLARAGATVVATRDGALVIGGRVGSTYQATLCRYDVKTGSVTQLSAGPAVQFAAAAAFHGSSVLIAGGLSATGPTDAVWVFDGQSASVSAVALPQKVYAAQATYLPGRDEVVVLGGLGPGSAGG